MTQMKTCNLDVNDSGGWRRVMQFNAADDGVSDQVLQAADMLLKNRNYSRPYNCSYYYYCCCDYSYCNS